LIVLVVVAQRGAVDFQSSWAEKLRSRPMKPSLVSMLRCTVCQSVLTVFLEKAHETEIMEGNLQCVGCHTSFPISGGVPNLMPPKQRESHVAQSFGFEWQTHHSGG
jgi:uncharacterized protein YbaR (Trm112 family)